MSKDTDLVTDGSATPAGSDGNVGEQSTGQFGDIHFDMSDDALASYLAKEGHIEMPEVTDEVVSAEPEEDEGEVEELSDDTVDEDVEAEDTAEDDESDQEENSDAEIEILSYEELFEQVGKLEIDGKEYTPAQLKSLVGQINSAGTKAREADAKLKEMEQKAALVDQYLAEKPKAIEGSNELAKLDATMSQLTEARKVAMDEGDMYEVSKIREHMEDLKAERANVAAKLEQVSKQEEAIAIQRFENGLEQSGFGYLNKKGPQATAWVQYAKSNLSDEEFQLAIRNPGIAAAIEKSRKMEEAKGKPEKKLSNKKSPTLKRSTRKAQTRNAEQELQRKMQSGTATREEIEAAIMAEGRALFK